VVQTSPARLPEQTPSPGRLLSLDVFRGGTIASMILVNNPGSSAAYPPLQHAKWHGWTFTDLVFPFFLWIVGVAMTLSLAKRVERGDDRTRLLMHIVKRSALIFLIGLFLNGFPYFELSHIRIPGVLQRIALCYLIAGIVFLYARSTGARASITAGLLVVYWVLMKSAAVPGCGAGSFEMDCNLAKWIDGLLLTGHMWGVSKTWDPEGLLSTLPAIANTMFGIFAGQILATRRQPAEKSTWMFFGGNVLMFAGLMLSTWMPINKQLWTVPFALFTSGMAFVVFTCCYWMVDVQAWRRYARPFSIYGVNALAVYFLAGIVGKLLILIRVGDGTLKTWIWRNWFEPLASPPNASLLYSLAVVALFWAIAWGMYRRNWIVRV
jgi:predicted acyltransferase